LEIRNPPFFPKETDPVQRKDKVEGEGSYSGTRDYNRRTRRFLESGKVVRAARAAAPRTKGEDRAMKKAERLGKARAKR
jgi:hypothetical protein